MLLASLGALSAVLHAGEFGTTTALGTVGSTAGTESPDWDMMLQDPFHAKGHGRDLQDAYSNDDQRVFVGVYVLNIANVQPHFGTFDADFYLFFSAAQGQSAYTGSCPPSGQTCTAADAIESVLPNAAKLPTVRVVNKFVASRNTTQQYRVKSTFYYKPEYKLWPFEQQQLRIIVEDPRRSNASLQFSPQSGPVVSPTLTAAGWKVERASSDVVLTKYTGILAAPADYDRDSVLGAHRSWGGPQQPRGGDQSEAASISIDTVPVATPEQQERPTGGGHVVAPFSFFGSPPSPSSSASFFSSDPSSKTAYFSRFTATLTLQRSPAARFVRFVLPPAFIALVQLLALAVGPPNATSRVILFSSGLTAAVLFHATASDQGPPSAGLRFGDKFMATVYAIIVWCGMAGVIVLGAAGARERRQAHEHMEQEITRQLRTGSFLGAPFLPSPLGPPSSLRGGETPPGGPPGGSSSSHVRGDKSEPPPVHRRNVTQAGSEDAGSSPFGSHAVRIQAQGRLPDTLSHHQGGPGEPAGMRQQTEREREKEKEPNFEADLARAALRRQVSAAASTGGGTVAVSEEIVARAGAWRVHRRFYILSAFFVLAAGISMVMSYHEVAPGSIVAMCIAFGLLGVLSDVLWGYRCFGLWYGPLELCCRATCGCELYQAPLDDEDEELGAGLAWAGAGAGAGVGAGAAGDPALAGGFAASGADGCSDLGLAGEARGSDLSTDPGLGGALAAAAESVRLQRAGGEGQPDSSSGQRYGVALELPQSSASPYRAVGRSYDETRS